MQAAAIPSAPPAPTAPAPTPAPTDIASGLAETGNNFVGTLMQLLGGTAPAALTSSAATTVEKTSTDSDSEDPTVLAGMLAMPLPAPMQWNPLPVASAGEGTDPLEMLGLGSGAAGKGQAGLDQLLALKSELAETLDDQMPEMAEGNDSIGSLSPLTDLNAAKTLNTEVPASRHVQAPVGSPQWAEEVGSKLTLMVDKGQQTASLKLSPENLGPLEVRISITDDKASVWFGAAHADTRAAIEHALPKLREMLSSTGLSLADTGVFHEPPRDQQTPGNRGFRGGTDPAAPEAEMIVSTRSLSLLDAYA